MLRKIEYSLCRTMDNKPLVTIDSPLGNGQEFEPLSLRNLAAALLKIAEDSEKNDLGKHYIQQKQSLGI